MFTWVKKLFNTEQTVQAVTTKPVVEELKATVAEVAVTTEVKTAPEKPATRILRNAPKKAETKAVKTEKFKRAALEKMTKVQIEALAQEKLGVELDRRKTKEFMIDDFLAAQKK
jgi:hypothetical protein